MISHKIHEVIKISNHITVLRDGQTIETLDNSEQISESRIIKGMVGRELMDRFPRHEAKIGEIGFEIKDWVVHDPLDEERVVIDHVDMNVRAGEIVGLAGLMGAGRTELAMSVFGRAYGKKITGTLIKGGREIVLHNVSQAIDNGIAYVTEDRKTAGLVLIQDIKQNITLANLKAISKKRRCQRRRSHSGGQGLPRKAEHQIVQHISEGGQPVGRQSAKSGAQQMDIRKSGCADTGRTDQRHRRGCQIRDIQDHPPAGGVRQVRDHDFVRTAGDIGNHGPPLHYE